jgi:Ni/Fe-hydrogenase subunit HybB-like protein
MLQKFRAMFVLFALAVLYFTVVHHLTKLYQPSYRPVEAFLLRDGGIYTAAFWIGQIAVGTLLPLAIVILASGRNAWLGLAVSGVLFLFGGVAQMYVTIVGGQAFPLRLFPGMDESSPFFDGQVHQYWPSLPELLLGVSGISIAMLIAGLGIKLLPFLPRGAAHPLPAR